MSLAEKLSALKARIESGQPPYTGMPPEAHAIMKRATEELVASGAAARVLRAGRAPSFELRDASREVVRLADLVAAGPVVLSFYRGVWCPFCNLDMRELELYAARIRAAGATLVAITPQTAANSRRVIADHALSFPMLSDPGNEVAARYGLRYRLPDELIALYRRLGVNLPVINDDDSWTLPIPARFIIDGQGEIRYAEANPDYTRRPEPDELLPQLERLQGARVA